MKTFKGKINKSILKSKEKYCSIIIPFNVKEELDKDGSFEVKITINEVQIISKVEQHYGLLHRLLLTRSDLKKIGKEINDIIRVSIENDKSEKSLKNVKQTISHSDLDNVLLNNQVANENWNRITNTEKKKFISHINAGKVEKTRLENINNCIKLLEAGLLKTGKSITITNKSAPNFIKGKRGRQPLLDVDGNRINPVKKEPTYINGIKRGRGRLPKLDADGNREITQTLFM